MYLILFLWYKNIYKEDGFIRKNPTKREDFPYFDCFNNKTSPATAGLVGDLSFID